MHQATLPDGTSFPVAEGQTLLEAANHAGLNWEFGCTVGACRTCLVRVRAGRVHIPTSQALTLDQCREGWVLPCVTTIGSDVAVEPGGDPSGALHALPWTD